MVEMSNENKVSEVGTPQREPERDQRIFPSKASQWIWLLFGILEVLIALRIGMKLIGVNPNNPIVALIYSVTTLFLVPFVGLIGSPAVGGMVLEISSLFAISVYALSAVALERLVWLIFYRPREPVVGVTDTTSSKRHTIL